MQKNKYEKNIPLSFIYTGFHFFNVTNAIWVLYMGFRGCSLWEIGLAEGIFHTASMLFEIPSGALADMWGRKKVLFLGRAFSGISSLLMLHAASFPEFIPAFIISALGYNFHSGTQEAMLYDSVLACGKEKQYLRLSSSLSILIEVVNGAAMLLGGLLSEKSFAYVYLFDIAVVFCSMLPIFFMEEPPVKREDRIEKTAILRHFRTVGEILREKPEILKIILFYGGISAVNAAFYFYGQEFFNQFGIARRWISTIMLVSSVVSCIGLWNCERLKRKAGDRLRFCIALGTALAILLCGMSGFGAALSAFLMANFWAALIEPIQSEALNSLIPTEQRSTIVSLESFCFSVAMILCFPVCGWAATRWGLRKTFLLLGVFELMGTYAVFRRTPEAGQKQIREEKPF